MPVNNNGFRASVNNEEIYEAAISESSRWNAKNVRLTKDLGSVL